MLLKYFYDQHLAHASYLVGCQATGDALVVDPARNVTPYLEAAAREGLRIVGAADTHIHADYVSGLRELAERVGARLYISDEGDATWKYHFAPAYDHQLLTDGDAFKIGNLRFDVLHTPGHTPEHISFLLTDLGGGADQPMGIFTGDFVFVGSVGRPDLLEKAAGLADTAADGARQMFTAIHRFRTLPDYLQVWPSHGAGSACGKGLGAVPSSTVGYEKLFNVALGYTDEAAFVDMLLDGQPEPPTYFAVMKQVNREGPPVLGERPLPPTVTPATLQQALAAGHQVLDLRPSPIFAAGHLPGALNIPLGSLATWAGWLADYTQPHYLITAADDLALATTILAEIGLDHTAGYVTPTALGDAGCLSESYEERPATALAPQILADEVTLLDVRAATEWAEGHLPQAQHIMLGLLPNRIAEVGNGRPVVVQCRSGARSAIAASVLQAQGIKNVVNLGGGLLGWAAAGLPIVNGGHHA